MQKTWQRRLSDVLMKIRGYKPNEAAFIAKNHVLPATRIWASEAIELFELDWKGMSSEEAKPLLGYLYGFAKLIAFAAGQKDPEVWFWASYQAIEEIFHDRVDFIALLMSCPWQDEIFKEGIEFGLADAERFINGKSTGQAINELIIEKFSDRSNKKMIQFMTALYKELANTPSGMDDQLLQEHYKSMQEKLRKRFFA